MRETDLIFYRPRPGVTLPPAELWTRHRKAGKWRKDGENLLEHLPLKEIMQALRSLPAWEETEQDGPDSTSARFRALKQPSYSSDVHFWTFWYGQKPGLVRDHLLRICCTDLTEEQMQSLIELLGRFAIPLQYREEDPAY